MISCRDERGGIERANRRWAVERRQRKGRAGTTPGAATRPELAALRARHGVLRSPMLPGTCRSCTRCCYTPITIGNARRLCGGRRTDVFLRRLTARGGPYDGTGRRATRPDPAAPVRVGGEPQRSPASCHDCPGITTAGTARPGSGAAICQHRTTRRGRQHPRGGVRAGDWLLPQTPCNTAAVITGNPPLVLACRPPGPRHGARTAALASSRVGPRPVIARPRRPRVPPCGAAPARRPSGEGLIQSSTTSTSDIPRLREPALEKRSPIVAAPSAGG